MSQPSAGNSRKGLLSRDDYLAPLPLPTGQPPRDVLNVIWRKNEVYLDIGDYSIGSAVMVIPVSLNLERFPELNPHTGSHIEVTWLILRLVNTKELSQNMIRFKGEEIWSGSGWPLSSSVRVKVSWTGTDFTADTGTRRPQEPGVIRRRIVYHPEAGKGRLTRIEGTLYFSPIEGFELPAIVIKDSAWM